MKKPQWQRVKWPYNDVKPYCDWECWRRGKVILYLPTGDVEGWSYVRTGANSDNAHSGFLKGYVDLTAAQNRIDELITQGRIVP